MAAAQVLEELGFNFPRWSGLPDQKQNEISSTAGDILIPVDLGKMW